MHDDPGGGHSAEKHDDHHDDGHDGHDHHLHGGLDPHVWHDPHNIIKMNKIITEETSPQCVECKKRINGKPWITVSCNGECVYACRYLCTKYLSNYVGKF